MLGIAELFAELDGYSRYEDDLEVWGALASDAADQRNADPWLKLRRSAPERKRRAVEAAQRWKKQNPKRYREQRRAAWHRIKTERPDVYRARAERRREYWREHKRKQRAKKRMEAS